MFILLSTKNVSGINVVNSVVSFGVNTLSCLHKLQTPGFKSIAEAAMFIEMQLVYKYYITFSRYKIKIKLD